MDSGGCLDGLEIKIEGHESRKSLAEKSQDRYMLHAVELIKLLSAQRRKCVSKLHPFSALDLESRSVEKPCGALPAGFAAFKW